MNPELQQLISKTLSGLIALVATVGITLAGFSLKSNYEAQLTIKELEVKMIGIEQSIADNRNNIVSNRLKSQEMALEGREFQTTVKSIKDDLVEIKKMLREDKKD